MRFPLPADTFPPLEILEEDRFDLQKLSNELLYESLDRYEEFRGEGELDKRRWKLVKAQEGLTAYRDLKVNNLEASRIAPKKGVGSGVITATNTKLHAVLAVGSIEGEFNDMAFGMINFSNEMLKIKTAYTNDKIADAKVLATIVGPTTTNPAQGTHLKWAVSVGPYVLLRKVVRPRDFVFLESTGIFTTKSGDRIGYTLMHSLQIPTIRELDEYQIVRANTSICMLFRQKSPGHLELYVKGFVDAMGNIHPNIAVPSTADALMSYRNMVHCGQMKKLNWLLKTRKTVILDFESKLCVVCGNNAHRPKRCEVCINSMCSRCSVTKKLSFLSPTSRRVSSRSLNFCTRCIIAAFQVNGLDIAAEELIRQSPFAFYEMSSSSTSSSKLASPTNTIPPDSTAEFFG